ncbi:MAG: SET domain-containing protein [Puniceicoccales bacterium]
MNPVPSSSDSLLDIYAEVRPSPIHGCGVFARTFIPAGTTWWKATVDNVMLLGRVQLETLAASRTNKTINGILSAARIYGYYSQRLDSIIVCLDNARYVNHSDEPNSGAPSDGDPLCSVTLRDIYAGEEIVENYGHYDPCPWSDLTCSPEVEEPRPRRRTLPRSLVKDVAPSGLGITLNGHG